MILLASIGCAASIYMHWRHCEHHGHRRLRKPKPYCPPLPYHHRRRRFDLDRWHPERVRRFLRFTKQEFRILVPLLQLEDAYYLHRVKPTPELALAVVCYRLSSPTRLIDCVDVFGHSEAWISIVFNVVTCFLDKRVGSILQWHPQLSSYERLKAFGQAVMNDGGQGDGKIWGFIDGTFVEFCRPANNEHQRCMYSGYYKGTGMKWQGIATPDGLISALYRPFAGPINDWNMLQQSGILDKCREVYANQPRLNIYRDPAYTGSFGIIGPYQHSGGRHALPTDEH
jgi:DDE superfamily endonuclease